MSEDIVSRPWTARVIASASGRWYKDGENIPMFGQEVLDSWPANTLSEARNMGDQIEARAASGSGYPDGARVSILSAPEFTFGKAGPACRRWPILVE